MCWGQLLRCRALQRTPRSPCHADICLCCWTQDRVLEGGETFIKSLQFYSGCKLLTSRKEARNSTLCISLPLLGSCLLPANAGMTPFANMSCHPLWWLLQQSTTACYYWQLRTSPDTLPYAEWSSSGWRRPSASQLDWQTKDTVGQNTALTPCLAQLMTVLCHQFVNPAVQSDSVGQEEFRWPSKDSSSITDAREQGWVVWFLFGLHLPLEQTSCRVYQSLLIFQVAASVTLQLNTWVKSKSWCWLFMFLPQCSCLHYALSKWNVHSWLSCSVLGSFGFCLEGSEHFQEV